MLRPTEMSVMLGLVLFADVAGADIAVGAKDWKIIERESGPVNYYSTVSEDGLTFVRSKYRPGLKTAVVGWKTPDGDRQRIRKVRWSWRAQTLPNGGDECRSGKEDSAAVVYLTWKRGLKYYTLKYVWSGAGRRGAVCDSKRNMFVAQDTIILETGGPLGAWKNEEVDLAVAFRHHFEGDDPKAEIPDFVGLGLMSDGDQTSSESSADFGTFTLTR
jgi:hypothetical protein